MKQSRIPFIVSLLVLFFFYLPILFLILQSFNEAKYGGSWRGFSLKWYALLFDSPQVWRAVQNTGMIALASTLVSTLIGTLSAWTLHRYRSPLQKVHYLLVYAPLVFPDILMGISLLMLFVNLGIPLGLPTVLLAHITFCSSYVAFVVMGRLQDFDDALIEAAHDLGANTWQTLTKVMIPVLAPGIMAGALLAFTLSIDDFVITFFVSGPGSATLPVYVFSMMKMGSPTMINALCTLFMLVTFSLVILGQRLLYDSHPPSKQT
jgi:spermidine/putrescine transport system permease protein